MGETALTSRLYSKNLALLIGDFARCNWFSWWSWQLKLGLERGRLNKRRSAMASVAMQTPPSIACDGEKQYAGRLLLCY
jgi:hypothetical protein